MIFAFTIIVNREPRKSTIPMSPKILYPYIIILGISMTFRAYSQVPTGCTTPSSIGAKPGGNFRFDNNRTSICLTTTASFQTVNQPFAGQSASALIYYIFDYKEGQKIAGTGVVLSTNNSKNVTIADADREYYVMQIVDTGADQFVTCNTIDIVSTIMPVVKVSDCGSTLKLTLPYDPANKYDSYFVNWNDGSPNEVIPKGTFPLNATHTYTGTQSRNIALVGNKGSCSSVPFNYTFNVNSNLYISRLEMTDKGMGAKLTFSNSNLSATYTIQADKNGSGSWLTVGSGTNGGGVIPASPGLDSTANYCFRIEGKDGCGNISQSYATCSINFKVPQVVSAGEVKLNWTSPAVPNSTGYSITRSEPGITPTPKYPTPITDNKFTDTDNITCKPTYTYQVTGKYDIPGAVPLPVVTISIERKVSTSAAATMLPALDPFGLASVEHNTAIKFVIADTPLKTKYRFERSVDNENNFKLVHESDGKDPGANEYDDKSVDPLHHRYCYRVSYSNECGNWSVPTAPLCSILLTSDGPASLTWTPFIDDPNYKANVVYDLYEVDTLTGLSKGNPILYHIHETKGIVNILDDTDSKNYIIVATYIPPGLTTGGIGSSSNTVVFQIPAKLFIPNAFTPNSDGSNENFIASGKHIAQFNMIIYDRWGNPIYESKTIKEGWDGNMVDRITAAPSGTYGYVAFVTDTHGQKFTRTGSVTLIR
jgi:gliding motility-associated-like protein